MKKEQITNWKPGDPLSEPHIETVEIPIQELPVRERYKLMVSTIVPRPIALVSTLNKKGQGNLAPFSFFNGVGTSPPAIMISIVPKKSGEKKDTLRNILETKEFVINGVSEWMLAPIHHCSAEFPYGEDELKIMKFHSLPSVKVKPPRVKGSLWQFECRLYNTMVVGKGDVGSGTIVVGEIVYAHVAKDSFKNGALDFKDFNPVARIGGREYVFHGDTIAMPAIDYAPKSS